MKTLWVRGSSRTHLGHDWLSIIALYIAERHLGAFMLVNQNFRVVNVLNLLQGHCPGVSSCLSSHCPEKQGLTFLMHDHARNTHRRVRGHLLRAQSSSGITLLAQFGSPI